LWPLHRFDCVVSRCGRSIASAVCSIVAAVSYFSRLRALAGKISMTMAHYWRWIARGWSGRRGGAATVCRRNRNRVSPPVR